MVTIATLTLLSNNARAHKVTLISHQYQSDAVSTVTPDVEQQVNGLFVRPSVIGRKYDDVRVDIVILPECCILHTIIIIIMSNHLPRSCSQVVHCYS